MAKTRAKASSAPVIGPIPGRGAGLSQLDGIGLNRRQPKQIKNSQVAAEQVGIGSGVSAASQPEPSSQSSSGSSSSRRISRIEALARYLEFDAFDLAEKAVETPSVD